MNSTFDKIQKYLFDDNIPLHEAQFTPHELQVRDRYRNVFVYWIGKPTLSEKKVVQYIQHEYGLSQTQAYRDIMSIKILLGNVKNAAKEWHRYKLITMVDETYQIAKDKRNLMAMAAVIDKFGKYTQLDKEEGEKIPYDEIVPQNFEPTGDVSVLGIKPIKNLRQKQAEMRKKYGGTTIEEAEFTMIEKEPNEPEEE